MKGLFYGLFVVSYSPFQANAYVQISGLHSQFEVMKQLLAKIIPNLSKKRKVSSKIFPKGQWQY